MSLESNVEFKESAEKFKRVASIAEIVVQQTLLDITDKEALPFISTTPVDFLHSLEGNRGRKAVQRFLQSDYLEHIVFGDLPVVMAMHRDGIFYENMIPNPDVFQKELVEGFRKICAKTPLVQDEHVDALRAWVEGEGTYPQLT